MIHLVFDKPTILNFLFHSQVWTRKHATQIHSNIASEEYYPDFIYNISWLSFLNVNPWLLLLNAYFLTVSIFMKEIRFELVSLVDKWDLFLFFNIDMRGPRVANPHCREGSKKETMSERSHSVLFAKNATLLTAGLADSITFIDFYWLTNMKRKLFKK